jgi:tetratricopeptide (TPR) repeat protein
MARRRFVLGWLFLGVVGCVGSPTGEIPAASDDEVGAAAGAREAARTGLAERQAWIAASVARAQAAGRPPGPVPSGDADADLVSVALLRAASDHRTADDVLVALLQANPSDPLIVFRVAEVDARAGRSAQALRLLDGIAGSLAGIRGARTLRAAVAIELGRETEGERALRELLVDPEEGPSAAFALVDLLTVAERFGDALAVLSAARSRLPERLDLQVVQARLMHDVWDLSGAADVLAEAAECHPGVALVALQRAELAVAAGDRPGAMENLAAATVDDAFSRAHRDRILGVQAAIESDPPSLTARDLLAMIRGAPSAGTRRQAFEAMQGEDVLRRAAVAAALGQSDPILRAVAVRAGQPGDPMFTDSVRRALADPDPRVRGAAARRLPEIPGSGAGLGLARKALTAEEDPYAFRALHEALTALVGAKVPLPPGGEGDPSVRSKTRQAWSRECPE